MLSEKPIKEMSAIEIHDFAEHLYELGYSRINIRYLTDNRISERQIRKFTKDPTAKEIHNKNLKEKAIVSKLLDPLLLKTLQKIGIKARDFEVLISLIIIAFPRAYSIYLVESRRAKQRKIAKQSVAEGDKIGKTAKTEDRPESQ